jgi:F-type H+-transporting ATPase subunit alpha
MSNHSEEYGIVELVRHPLVAVRGLPGAQVGELVEFSNGVYGQVFSLGVETLDVLVFSPKARTVGESVTRTGQPFLISVSEKIKGATVSPLSNLTAQQQASTAIDVAPQLLIKRRRITQPLNTGVSIVDLVLPLGKGQRQLIVGDRKTGKTSFAIQLSELQVQMGSLVVYAVIGKLQSEIKRIQETFAQKGIASEVTLVAAAADDPPSVIYQTPFVAMAIAEYLNSLGRDVVVIFDDLTTHAKYYREVALIAKRFPGRDSYPGDIYFTYARLLERGGCFTHPTKPDVGVAITCLPIAETSDADLTDFIVSNLISMTDGHLLFDNTVYAQGHRPAIHPGLSVTRVGKQTQLPVQRDLTHYLTSFINQYQKTVGLTHFGAELTGATKSIIARGESLFSFLDQSKEKIFSPNVMLILCGAVLQDWFIQTTPQAVRDARDALQSHYISDEKTRKILDELVAQTKNLSELQSQLAAQRAAIEPLWAALKQ